MKKSKTSSSPTEEQVREEYAFVWRSFSASDQSKDETGFLPLIKSADTKTRSRSKDNTNGMDLVYAARDGKVVVVERLLRAGADPDTKDELGYGGLHYASSNNNMALVSLLIKGGADMEIRNTTSMMTPLHYAAVNNHAPMVEMLLGLGANEEAKNKYKKTPLELAKLLGKRAAHGAFLDSMKNERANKKEDDDIAWLADGQTWVRFASAFHKAGCVLLAGMLLDEGLRRDPIGLSRDASLWYTCAEIRCHAGKYAEAKVAVEHAARLEPACKHYAKVLASMVPEIESKNREYELLAEMPSRLLLNLILPEHDLHNLYILECEKAAAVLITNAAKNKVKSLHEKKAVLKQIEPAVEGHHCSRRQSTLIGEEIEAALSSRFRSTQSQSRRRKRWRRMIGMTRMRMSAAVIKVALIASVLFNFYQLSLRPDLEGMWRGDRDPREKDFVSEIGRDVEKDVMGEIERA